MAKAQNQFDEIEQDGRDEDESAGIEIEDGDGMVVDLSQTDENVKYPVIPKGIYDAELVELEYGRSQRSNNPMWTTIWELTDEKVANDKGQQPRMWMHLTFNEGGMPRVKRALARMKCEDGYNLELLEKKWNPAKVADEGRLIGATARLRIDIRRYEGQNRNNVREILPPAGGSAGGSSGFANL